MEALLLPAPRLVLQPPPRLAWLDVIVAPLTLDEPPPPQGLQSLPKPTQRRTDIFTLTDHNANTHRKRLDG